MGVDVQKAVPLTGNVHWQVLHPDTSEVAFILSDETRTWIISVNRTIIDFLILRHLIECFD